MTKFVVLLSLVLAAACSTPTGQPTAAPTPGDDRARALADAYLDGYFERNPELATYYGVRGRRHDRLGDNSPDALKAWQSKEDAWLTQARTIESATIAAAPLKATHAIVREALDGGVAARACHTELWNVSQMTGWHVQFGYLVTIQPVGTDKARAEALARWQSLPTFIDTEIENLREGLKLGYAEVRHQSVSRPHPRRRRRAADVPRHEDQGVDRRFLIASQPSIRRLISFSNPRSVGW